MAAVAEQEQSFFWFRRIILQEMGEMGGLAVAVAVAAMYLLQV